MFFTVVYKRKNYIKWASQNFLVKHLLGDIWLLENRKHSESYVRGMQKMFILFFIANNGGVFLSAFEHYNGLGRVIHNLSPISF